MRCSPEQATVRSQLNPYIDLSFLPIVASGIICKDYTRYVPPNRPTSLEQPESMIIAAVSKDRPSYTVVVGNPACVVKSLQDEPKLSCSAT